MKKIIFFMLLLSLTSFSLYSQQNEIIFSDNFDSYENGSIGAPIWNIIKGNWLVENRKFVQKSLDYDCNAMLNIFFDFSFRLEFKFPCLKASQVPALCFFLNERTTLRCAT